MMYQLSEVQAMKDGRGDFEGVEFDILNESGAPIVTFGYLDPIDAARARGLIEKANRGRGADYQVGFRGAAQPLPLVGDLSRGCAGDLGPPLGPHPKTSLREFGADCRTPGRIAGLGPNRPARACEKPASSHCNTNED